MNNYNTENLTMDRTIADNMLGKRITTCKHAKDHFFADFEKEYGGIHIVAITIDKIFLPYPGLFKIIQCQSKDVELVGLSLPPSLYSFLLLLNLFSP